MSTHSGHGIVGGSIALALLCVVSGCRAVKPEVGPFRAVCVGDNPYGSPEGGVTGKNDPRCLPNSDIAEDECGICENANCCAERFGCYDDLGCNCADQAFDACLDKTGGDGSDETAAVAQCWSVFEGSGPKAKARVACQRSACESVCEVPPL
jgi:hypothetical protein